MTDAELIAAAIKASGLSARKFAVTVLIRDERTIRRWLAGENPLPQAVRARCEAIVKEAES
jgi:Arc/MetJ family transcription regulator